MTEDRLKQLKNLLDTLDIKDRVDYSLINQSLTHPSYLFDAGSESHIHNQRLEFLGDAVVGLVIAQYMYLQYPQKTEGELTKMRASVVCESSLAHGARQLNLGKYLLMGKGEVQMGGSQRASNLADCFEAFIGALYLCLSIDGVRSIILNVLQSKITHAASGQFGDYKTQLQELVQKSPDNKLFYKIIAEHGPDHDKIFIAAVYLNDEKIFEGQGHTKKEAEQQAAKGALNNLGAT